VKLPQSIMSDVTYAHGQWVRRMRKRERIFLGLAITGSMLLVYLGGRVLGWV
jgi:hypothetical protein